MDMFHATTAAPSGLHGGDRFPSERIGTPESGGLRLPGARGAVLWAVVMSAVAASAVAFAGPVPTSYIYGIDDDSKLWVMALSGTEGTSTFLGTSVLTASSANGLAYDNSRQQLFGVDTTTSELYWWQQGATNYTSLGNISAYTTGIGEPVSAAFYNNAYWFLGSGATGNVLGKLDLTYVGNVPTIASGTSFIIDGMPTSASGGGDMVITPAGTLFAYSALGVGNFFTADLNSIASGTVGGYSSIRTAPFASDVGLQLSLGVDNVTLYGHDRDTGNWFIVDTTNGSTTPVDLTTTPYGGKGFRDLGGSSVQAVPEPSSLALAAMGGGIVFWQVHRRRRRTTHGKGRGPHPSDLQGGHRPRNVEIRA